MPDDERMPWIAPHDRDAERAIIASALRDNATILDVAASLRTEDFFVYAHQAVWKALTAQYLDSGAVDVVSLADKLKASDALADAGGYGYLVDLVEQYASPQNVEHYAQIVRAFALRRSLIELARETEKAADDRATPPEQTIESVETAIFKMTDQGRASQAAPVKVAVEEAAVRIDARRQKVASEGVKTGWPDLDKRLGFMEDGALIIVAARPAVGKTAFALNLAWKVARGGDPVFFGSLEQPRRELGERLIAMETEINTHLLRSGHLSEGQMLAVDQAVLRIGELPLTIDDAPNQGVLNIAATTRRARIRDDLKLVVIDYLQLIKPSEEAKRQARQEQVAEISRRLKLLARELHCPVVCLAQVNRKAEDRIGGRAKLADLRESGAIEQDADVVLLLHKEGDDDEDADQKFNQEIEVEIAKNRNGPVGSAALMFTKGTLRFESSGEARMF